MLCPSLKIYLIHYHTFRLTAKYEEMYLKNIREQQSIIDSSQEFLMCKNNNEHTDNNISNNKNSNINDIDNTCKQQTYDKSAPPSVMTSKKSPTLSVKTTPRKIPSSNQMDISPPPCEYKPVVLMESETTSSNKMSHEYMTPMEESPKRSFNNTPAATSTLPPPLPPRQPVNTSSSSSTSHSSSNMKVSLVENSTTRSLKDTPSIVSVPTSLSCTTALSTDIPVTNLDADVVRMSRDRTRSR